MNISRKALANRYYELYKKGMTLQAIADQTGFSKQYISQLFNAHIPEFEPIRKPKTQKSKNTSKEEQEAQQLLESNLTPEEIEILRNLR